MSENKITQEQLEELQDLVGKLNNAATQIGNLELQKHQLQHAAAEVQTDLNKLQAKLEEKYGKVQINIQADIVKLDGATAFTCG
jgi:predicted nuclease with TOPRIM domain